MCSWHTGKPSSNKREPNSKEGAKRAIQLLEIFLLLLLYPRHLGCFLAYKPIGRKSDTKTGISQVDAIYGCYAGTKLPG